MPGNHDTPDGYLEVSEEAFAESVLSTLPDYLLYRIGRTVGVITGAAGGREFFPCDIRHMRLFSSQHTRLTKAEYRRGGNVEMVRVNHTTDLASLVLGRAELSDRVRRLDRILHHPAYGRSFELLRPGWTEGTLYDPPDELSGLQPETDREVITQTLDDLVIDFPFLEEEGDGGAANRENFFGLLLTPIVRTALEGNVPLHLVNAPLERTGKSKLVEEVLGGIVLGTQMAALQQVGEGEEFDKRVLGLLKQAETLVHLDNVNDGLALGQLASALTATYYQGRTLGKNEMLKLLNTLIWVVSGNNVEASGEIIKRVIPIHLQPKTDKPEMRPLDDFQHPDLRRYIREVRCQVLSCLIGMVENWKSAKRPLHSQPMGGFEQWSAIVGGILNANGYVRWMTNASSWRISVDRRGGDLEGLVDAWAQRYGDHPIKAKHVVALAIESGAMEEQRQSAKDGGTRAIGKILSKSINRPVGNYRIGLKVIHNTRFYRLIGAPHIEGVTLEDEHHSMSTPDIFDG